MVVDNASDDGTVDMIRSEFDDVRLVVLDRNVGFAAGMNLAAEEAEGEYLLLLNPDTVVREDAVANLVRFARARPEHGLYGGRTFRPDGCVCPGSCWGLPSLWSLFCFATMLNTAFKGNRVFDPESLGGWKRDTVREVGIVTGCLLLASKRFWSELGGFDTRFFMYGEDADLSMRARTLGARPAITPDAVVEHEVGVSSAARPDKLLLLFSGKTTLLRKNWRRPKRDLGLALIFAGVGVRAALAALRPNASSADSAWRVLWHARGEWFGGYGPAPAAPPLRPTAERASRP